MKNFKVKWLLLSIILSVASINTAWADLYLIGSMNNWDADNWSSTYKFVNNKLEVTLAANTKYWLRIKDGTDHDRYFKSTVTNTIIDWNMDQDNTDGTIILETAEAGTYIFHYQWTGSQHHLSIYYPRARLNKNSVLYFDATSSAANKWRNDPFHAKFVYKFFDTGSNFSSGAEQWSESPVETWVYYTNVPNNDYVGQIQVCRINPNDHANQWNYSNNALARERSDNKQNCMVFKSAHVNYDNTQEFDWTTYCPPMSSASLSDNSTSKISWQTGSGTSGDPYFVPASGTIKVSASATSAVDDDNMTKKYDFKVNTGSGASSAQSGTSSTFNKTSLSNNTTYEISLDAWNNYNSTDGTKNSSATHIWYKALTMYTATHTMTNVTKSAGRDGSNAAAYHLAYSATYAAATGYNLPSTITVKFGSTTKTAGTDYTWNQSTGVLSIPVNKVDGNITVIISGVAKTYTATGNLNEGDGGSAGTYTATYDATTIAIGTTPVRAGYVVEGYYKSYSDGTYTEKIADASGNLQSNTSYTTSNKWANDGNVTLYTKWTPVELTFKSDASTSAWGTASNWNPACVPTIEHDVVLMKSAVVTGGTTAAAKSVKIDGSSSTVKLTIESTGALIVAEDIQAKHEGEGSYGATNENDLRIESNASGNGTLIVGNASTNTMASYQAYSKSWYVSGGYGYINQYIGIPFDEIYAYQYYGRILYEYDDVHDAWKASSTTMEAFKAYNILSKTNSYDYFYLDGKLNLPGKDGAGRLQTLICGSRTGNGVNENGDYMFANSWTAPIYITAMDEDDFVNVAQTIYIFNAGSNKGGTGAPGALGDNPGQWTTITLADPVVNVIPSTQAFLVKNTASGGTLTLDYNKHVFAPAKAAVDAGEDISTEPIRAPKHVQTNDNPSTRLNIIVRGNDIYSDYVRIHERADFTNDYDDGWEGAKIFGIAAAPQLYAISDIGRMAVNAVPEIEGMVIGFTKGSADDTYTMSFEYDGEEALYLNDLKEQTSTLIAADNSYQFTSAANDTEARFVISRTPIAHTPTGVSDINNQQSAARKLMIDGKLYIIRDGGIYDATGTMVK